MNWQAVLHSPRNWIIGIAAILITLLLALLFFNKFQPQNDRNTSQNVPELTDILSSDENKRLNAARRLAERVDVEESLEILYNSPLPRTGEGHLVVHQIGFYAYKKYGVDAILHCKDYFLYACYHGAIIEAASDQGFEVIPKMTERCKESHSRYFQCIHAAGHAIVAMWDYDLPKALAMCDDFYENETDFPGVVTSCHNGAFMENIFGVHDWGTGREPKRDWLSETDHYFPCNQFAQKYQEGCWLNQASRMFFLNKGDIPKTTKDCEGIGQEEYKDMCIDSLARQIHGLTRGDPSAVFPFCKQMGTTWYDSCLITNAGAFYSVSGRDEGVDLCTKFKSDVKQDCYTGMIALIVRDSIQKSEKERLCRKMDSPFADKCLTSVAGSSQ